MRRSPPRLSARQRGYTRAWEEARKDYLTKHPLCVICTSSGHTVRATVVDHITPHRGDQKLFWNKYNWQPLCATHHNSTKKRDEARGTISGSSNDGSPIDPNHHWNN